jgi:hypothetical protein
MARMQEIEIFMDADPTDFRVSLKSETAQK